MATGEVHFVGSAQIGAGAYSGDPVSNAFDNVFTTDYASSTASGGWVGLDMGVAVEVTEFLYAPSLGTPSSTIRVVGLIFKGSNTSGTAGLTTLATIAAVPFAPCHRNTGININLSGTTYRYYILADPGSNYCNVSELGFIGKAGTAANAKPVQPTIAPWGGRYLSGSATVTLTCRTTSASIYYTLDGSTPTNASTLYSGPFSVNCSSADIQLNVIGYDASLSTPTSLMATAYFSAKAYVPRADWYDDAGNTIEAHSGHILDNTARDGYYYWYGQNCQVGEAAGGDVQGSFGVWCYRSADLYNWTLRGQLTDNGLSGGTNWGYVIRPHVLYNASTSKYVMWVHAYNSPPGASDRAAIATSSSPDTGFTWSTVTLNPDGVGYKDSNLFLDTNGTAYVVYTNGAQSAIVISQLATDFLSTVASLSISAGGREAPVLFKRGSTYFLITSASNFYNSGATYTICYAHSTASNPLSGWSAVPGPGLFSVDPVGGNYNAQPSCMLVVPNKVDGYLYMADYWVDATLWTSRQVWLPMTFPTSTTLAPTEPASWDLSTFANSSTGVVVEFENLFGQG